MGKFKIILILFFIAPLFAHAQDKAYEKGEKVLNVGISLGYYGYGYFGNRTGFTLPLNAAFEYGITEQISVGPYVGYARWAYEYNVGAGNTEYSWSFLAAGARGSFHYTEILNELTDGDINEEKVDLYVSLLIGLEFRSYKDDSGFDYYDNDTAFRLGANLGVRYLLSKNVGVYLEGGRGTFGWLNLGVTARF
ncbi:MAG: hypothetical protein RLO12_16060 [Fulvivirga sp.]